MPDTTPFARALHDWQADMHAREPSRHARQLRSQLRRARTVQDARTVGGLYRVLRDGGVDAYPYDSQVLAVLLLPHVKSNTDALADGGVQPGPSFATLAARGEGQRPTMSDLRFRRLIEHESVDDLAGPLVRALRMTGGAASVSRLARDLAFWRPTAARHPRTEWAHDYYTTLLHA